MGSPVVKICGVRTVHQARVAAEAGADMVGLVFAESRRRVTPAEAHEVTAAAYVRRPRFVGVFVNEDPDVIGRLAGELRLDLVQLSGDEAPEECAGLRVPYLKVVHVRSGMWPKGPLPDPGGMPPGSGSGPLGHMPLLTCTTLRYGTRSPAHSSGASSPLSCTRSSRSSPARRPITSGSSLTNTPTKRGRRTYAAAVTSCASAGVTRRRLSAKTSPTMSAPASAATRA